MHISVNALPEPLVTVRVTPFTAVGNETLRLLQSCLDGGSGEEHTSTGIIMKAAYSPPSSATFFWP